MIGQLVADDQMSDEQDDDLEDRLNKLLDDILKDVCAWLLKQLQIDFEWQSDRERCIEDIEANDYTFDETGVVL